MYAKIMYPDRDVVQECTRTELIHGDPPYIRIFDGDNTLGEIAAPEGKDLTVYLMNEEGKTIDKYII